MRRVVVAVATRGLCAIIGLLMLALCSSAIAGDFSMLEPPVLLTNLLQLRRCAEQNPVVLHPFRIVADVLDTDRGSGVLVLRDASGVEFVHLDFRGQKIESGAKVCVEGRRCGVRLRSFGLVIIPGLVVDNDGLHPMAQESGTALLHSGVNPITVQWFNRLGSGGLKVQYEGRGIPRQPIPSSTLLNARIEPETDVTNFSPGLNYQCYEGGWGQLPDFTDHHPARTGVATNFDLNVETRRQDVGLEFNGFLRVPRDGTYTFYLTSDDGSRLCAGESSLDVRVLSKGPVPLALENLPTTVAERRSRPWVTLKGKVIFGGASAEGGRLLIQVGNDDIRVDIFPGNNPAPDLRPGASVVVSGLYEDIVMKNGSRAAGVLFCTGWKAIHSVPASDTRFAATLREGAGENRSESITASRTRTTPVISSAAEVKALSPELASRRLPVSFRGVVTSVLPSFLEGVVVQDSTKGIFVSLQDIKDSKRLQCGEFCEITGVSGRGLFAPIVIARRIKDLGAGQFPEPVHPTYNQLMNGSLDTQYAEIEGVVTAVRNQQIALLTKGGKINLELTDFPSEVLAGYENALVRIRGCVFAIFNDQTHEIEAGSLRVMSGVVDVVHAAPRDLFAAPQKSLGDLLLYDPEAAPLRRLKVSGQVIYRRAGEYFLTDGTNGIRVMTVSNSGPYEVGDLLDAVGFLRLEGSGAELEDAVMRRTGHAPLPAPMKLATNGLLQAHYAGTLVQVDGTLMNYWQDGPDDVLGLQSGFLAFRARIDRQGRSISLPTSGSRLELTGVYVPLGNRADDGSISGFQLLLHSPADIRILAIPSWWTLTRVVALAGILAGLLLAVLIWVKQLQRQVQQRGLQLETEIRKRQQTELQHATEAERSRIARDLHDELGSGLTEMSLLANSGLEDSNGTERKNERFHKIARKARALASGLDVIVWAIDPERNTLQSFADYLGCYAEELLSASKIVCRLKIPIECGAATLTGSVRHSLLLAVKEGLNNVIRHSSAKEVELRMIRSDDRLEILIADNGCGFDLQTVQSGSGLRNLHERISALHGRCDIKSSPGGGTTIKLIVPLRQALGQIEHRMD